MTALNRDDSVDTDLGSMTVPNQIEIVKEQVKEALVLGAKMVTGIHPDQWPQDMHLSPIVLVGTPPEARVNVEETFGSVVTVSPFDSEEEATMSIWTGLWDMKHKLLASETGIRINR